MWTPAGLQGVMLLDYERPRAQMAWLATMLVLSCGHPGADSGPEPAAANAAGEETMTTMLLDSAGEGRPLVLVGGGLTGWLSWIPHQERLVADRQVLRAQPLIVQLGLENRPLPADYSIKIESAALRAGLDDRDLRGELDLVAWSYGGVITLDYALDNPERVRTLTLIEPPAYWVLAATGGLDETSRRELEAIEAISLGPTDDVTEEQLADFIRFASLGPPGEEPSAHPSWPIWVEHRRSLRGQGAAMLGQGGDAARLRAFDRPVLLVRGAGSTPILHRIVDRLAESMPRSETIELPGGHAPQIVAMDAFLERLAAFQDVVELPVDLTP